MLPSLFLSPMFHLLLLRHKPPLRCYSPITNVQSKLQRQSVQVLSPRLASLHLPPGETVVGGCFCIGVRQFGRWLLPHELTICTHDRSGGFLSSAKISRTVIPIPHPLAFLFAFSASSSAILNPADMLPPPKRSALSMSSSPKMTLTRFMRLSPKGGRPGRRFFARCFIGLDYMRIKCGEVNRKERQHLKTFSDVVIIEPTPVRLKANCERKILVAG
jgi:hypothetical protein